ncbi:MAG: hypothetical protein LBM19_03760 [Holosporales bacterium]|nr:hypothetical protein [Holosporales bacterium]
MSPSVCLIFQGAFEDYFSQGGISSVYVSALDIPSVRSLCNASYQFTPLPSDISPRQSVLLCVVEYSIYFH